MVNSNKYFAVREYFTYVILQEKEKEIKEIAAKAIYVIYVEIFNNVTVLLINYIQYNYMFKILAI